MASPKGPFYREFGKRLSQARRAAKITQAALAQAVGLSRTSIVNIEKGRQPVPIDLAIRMATSLGTGIVDLLPESNPISSLRDMASELRRISPGARPWVERVISGSDFRKDSEHDTEIFAGKTQGPRASQGREHKTGSGRR
jgi:DNA-binding XRE family transcriptional regulator